MIHVTTCPHCGTRQIALKVVQLVKTGKNEASIYFLCPNCRSPVCARTLFPDSSSTDDYMKNTSSANNLGFSVGQIWPSPKEPIIPESLPDAVTRSLRQAETNFFQEGHEEAASVMYRKALELGLRAVEPTLTGMLASRIEKLGNQGRLTSDLVEWAKEIKNLGNDGAHEDTPIERSELEALRGLTEMVLRYLFTLPELVRVRRAKSQLESAP